MMSFNPKLVPYTDAQAQQFFRNVAEQARSAPRVKSAALAYKIPMGTDQDVATIVAESYRFPQGKESSTPWPCRSFEAGRSL